MTQLSDMAGKVAVVTGGGSGIGLGIADGFATHGVAVMIADVDGARGQAAADQLVAAGGRAASVTTDVRDTDQVRAAVDATVERFGTLDILVNNAGGVRGQPFVEQSERSWRRHIDLNLVSVLAGVSAAAPVMAGGGRGGAILNVVSIEAARAAPRYAVYAACKAAVVSFTRTMALELAADGIRVNAIAPDVVATPGIGMGTDQPPLSPEAEAGFRAYVPLGRVGDPSDTAGAALFLCSDLGRYVTGVTLPVDGGTWASSGWTRTPDDGGAGGAGGDPGGWQLHPR